MDPYDLTGKFYLLFLVKWVTRGRSRRCLHLHDISIRTRTVKPQIFPSGKSVSGVIHVALDGGGALNGYAFRVLRVLGRGGGAEGGMTGLQL